MVIDSSNNSIDSTSNFAISSFSNILYNVLKNKYNSSYTDLVIVCIGTDRSTGDCLGPLVGYLLSKKTLYNDNINVVGTLDNPVHAKNLIKNIKSIKSEYINPFIIAIDASLGKIERVGYVSVWDGPLMPGAGVNKKLPKIGDIHITGVVNVSGFMEYMVLQNTRLNIVMNMANVISSSLFYSINKLIKPTVKTVQ